MSSSTNVSAEAHQQLDIQAHICTFCQCHVSIWARWLQGVDLEGIARQRVVQLGTVQSYIAEAMAAGHPYPWHRLGVPQPLLATLCIHLTAFHKLLQQQQQTDVLQQQQQQQQQSDVLQQQQQDSHIPQQQVQIQQHAQVQQQQPGHMHQQAQVQTQHWPNQQQVAQCWPQQHPVAVPQVHEHRQWQQHPDVVLDMQHVAGLTLLQHSTPAQGAQLGPQQQQRQLPQHWSSKAVQGLPAQQATPIATANTSATCQEATAQAGKKLLCPRLWLQPNGMLSGTQAEHSHLLPDMDMVKELVKTGQGTRALREYMGPDVISYGQMRMALAHIYCLMLRHLVTS